MILSEEYVPMKIREIAVFMSVSREDRPLLKEILDELVAEGVIELTARGKYVKPVNRTVTGTFIGHARGFGFVSSDETEEDIFIPAPYVNGAFHGDTVRVRVAPYVPEEGKRPEGMVLKILSRGTKTLIGTYLKESGFVVPDDSRLGRGIHIMAGKTMQASDADKVTVAITSYGEGRRKPEGKIIEILGNAMDPATDTLSVLRSLGIDETFPKAALEQAKEAARVFESGQGLENKGSKREDLRDWFTVTIDGEDARDLDDAVTLKKTEKDGVRYELGVHIADVSHYVTEDSALDIEARHRGTSVYLPDMVVPMLPGELSNGICSLNAGEDRLALSCIMTFDSRGNVTDHRITESVIHVDHRLSYTGVQAILDGHSHPEGETPAVVDLCFLMREAAAVLKERRRRRGSIEFDFPESKIKVDDRGYPVEIEPYLRTEATDLIEDFMLLANETVAEDYYWQELPFLYRVHEEPAPDRIRQLAVLLGNFGYHIKTGRDKLHPKEIQKLLFSLEGEPEEALISRLTLRTMSRARYAPESLGHFGLSADYYTHFTSPIRRYPDLQIHRIIKENLKGKLDEKRISHYEKILPDVARTSSELERRADQAEREVDKLKKVEYMQERIGSHYDGVISGITGRGFFVELPNTVEGFVPVEYLMDDYYLYDAENYCLTGDLHKRKYTLGQKIRIMVVSADKVLKTIEFAPEEEE